MRRAESLTAAERTLLAVGTLVFLSCFPAVLLDLTPGATKQYDFRALVFPTDIAAAAVCIVAVRQWRLPRLAMLAGVVGVLLMGAFVFNPSLSGMLMLLRWAGIVAVVALADRRLIVGCVGAWAVFEALLALAQKVNGGPLGLPSLLENRFSFSSFGGSVAPPGSLVHPYLLAGLAFIGGTVLAVAARERRWLLWPAAVAIAPVGFTYSRTSLIAIALVAACFLAARFPAAALAVVLGAGLPALAWNDGWVTRARTSVESEARQGLGTGRGALIEQSLDLIREKPLTGVGPGLYVESLGERGVDKTPSGGVYKPVHNVPLLVAAEGGILAGMAMLTLIGSAGWIAFRRGPLGWALFGAFAPFLLLDHFAYTFPQGNVMLGLWLAAIVTTGRVIRPAPTGTTA